MMIPELTYNDLRISQMPSLFFQELYNDPTELNGLFDIHPMAYIIDNQAAGRG